MPNIKDIDKVNIILKPESFDEEPGIFCLKHFNDLENDMINSCDDLLYQKENNENMVTDAKIVTVTKKIVKAYVELKSIISQLSLIDNSKQRYINTCDYQELAIDVYIKNKKIKYPTTSLRRHIKVIALYMDDEINRNPELYKHLVSYMRNFA